MGGAVLMGFGAVIAAGCSVGQGGGLSALSLTVVPRAGRGTGDLAGRMAWPASADRGAGDGARGVSEGPEGGTHGQLEGLPGTHCSFYQPQCKMLLVQRGLMSGVHKIGKPNTR